MKITGFDFCLGFGVATLLFGLTAAICYFGVAPLTELAVPAAYGAVVNLLMFATLFGVLAGLLVRLMIWMRPLAEGHISMESSEFVHFKLLTMIHHVGKSPLFLINTSPGQPLMAMLFGARVGSNVAIGGEMDTPWLISISANCIIGYGSMLSANVLNAGRLEVGKIEIGPNTTVGAFSFVLPNVKIGQGVTIAPYSLVLSGTVIPDGETWKGNPARKWI